MKGLVKFEHPVNNAHIVYCGCRMPFRGSRYLITSGAETEAANGFKHEQDQQPFTMSGQEATYLISKCIDYWSIYM